MGEKLVKSNKLLLIMFVSLIIIGFLTLSNFLSFINIQKIIIEQLKENQLTEVEHAAGRMENHILEVKNELITLSKFPVMETLDINECSGNMRIVHENIVGKIDSILRVDKDGNVIECSSPRFSDYLGLNVKNKDYFKIPKEKNEPFITGVVRQGEGSRIILSVPLFETSTYTPYPDFRGEFKGIFLSIIEINKLYNLYLHPYISPNRNYFLLFNIDTEDTILKSDNIDDYSILKEYFPISTENMDTILKINGMGETIVTSSDVFLGSEKWRLIVLTPLKNVSAEIRSVQNRHLFSLIFILIVSSLALFSFIRLYKTKEEMQSKLEKANVTLEKLGINIEIEKEKYSDADITLATGKVYLVKEDDENNAHELFISTLNRGFAGLGIVRENPQALKKKYNLEKTPFIWLTNTKVEGIPCETNIETLKELISEFIKKSEKSVVLIDRLDYIITENQFEKVIKNIHFFNDLAMRHECIFILSINPELIEESQLKTIEAESIDLFGKQLKQKVELTELEMNILNYINQKNINNQLVSFKNITLNFKITKPTTRVKIRGLLELGLLQVEQKGRFKSIKITSAGRRIIN